MVLAGVQTIWPPSTVWSRNTARCSSMHVVDELAPVSYVEITRGAYSMDLRREVEARPTEAAHQRQLQAQQTVPTMHPSVGRYLE